MSEKKKKKVKKGRRVGKLLLYLLGGVVLSYFGTRYDFSQYFKMIKKLSKIQLEKKEKVIEKELPLVKVFHAVLTKYSDNLPVIGSIKGFQELEMRFQTNGVIEHMNFQEGDLVNKGDVMANLIQDEAAYKIEYQKANYETAQAGFLGAAKKLSNAEKMFNAGGIVISKLDESVLDAESAALKMKSARFEYLSAKNDLKKTEIYATVDGILAVKSMDEGEFVSSNDKVYTLMELSRVYVEVGIVEKDVDKVAIGLTAQANVDTYPGVVFEGILSTLSPVISGKSRTMSAKVELNNDELLLLPGMFARTNISVYETEEAFILPASCIKKGKAGYVINLVSADDKVIRKKIEVVYFSVDKEYVEIKGELAVDDFVIMDLQQELKEGTRIQVIEVQESPFVG